MPAELGVFGFFAFFALMRSCLTERWSGKCWVRKSTPLTEFLPANGLGVGVETEEDALVDQWVLMLSPWTLGDLGVGRSDNGLDHSAVDDASDIGVGDLGSGKAGEESTTGLRAQVDKRTCSPSCRRKPYRRYRRPRRGGRKRPRSR